MSGVPRTVAVIVTYGNRGQLVARSLPAALSAGACHVVLVDNGSVAEFGPSVTRLCDEGQVTLIRHSVNEGSAGGYYAGMVAALAQAPDFLLLLDDDNIVGPDYIAALQDVLRRQGDADVSAAIGLRAAHAKGLATESGHRPARQADNSFLGFALREVPAKVLRRMQRRQVPPQSRPTHIEVARAPYGGLLLPASLCAEIGLPDRRFVLYEDDTEYTLRISRGRGHIWMVPALAIEDIDASWTAEAGPRSALAVWLTGGPEFRVFYTMRNHSYLDRHYRATSALPFWLNFSVYALALVLLALLTARPSRATLFLRAIHAGLTGKLGRSERYALP